MVESETRNYFNLKRYFQHVYVLSSFMLNKYVSWVNIILLILNVDRYNNRISDCERSIF